MPYELSLDKNKTAVLLVVFLVLLALVFLAGLLSGFLVQAPDQAGLAPVLKIIEKAAAPAVVKPEETPPPVEEKSVPNTSPLTAEGKPEEKSPPIGQEKPEISSAQLSGLARAGWIVIDELKEGTSAWSVTNGVLLQSADMPEEENNSEKLNCGAYALTGKDDWINSSITLKMRSHDDDTIGVLFRYQDADNYYLFSMDSQRKNQRLVGKHNGSISVLAENSIAYKSGKWYAVKIDLMDENISIELDETGIFEVTDGSLKNGKIGMYSRGNKGSEFKDVVVISFDKKEKIKEQTKPVLSQGEELSIVESEAPEEDEKVSSTGMGEEIGHESADEKNTEVGAMPESQEKTMAAEEESVEPVSNDHAFSVQAGAFLKKNNADKFSARLRGKGYGSYVFTITDSNDRIWHAVRANNYKNLKEASSGLAIFKSKEKIPAIITRIDSISLVNPVKTIIPQETSVEPPEAATEDEAMEKEEQVPQKSGLTYPYSIRLSSYRSLKETRKAILYYEKRGIPSYFIKIDLGEKGAFRLINTGCYRSFEEANRVREKLNVKGSVVRKTPYACLIGVYALKDVMTGVIRDLQDLEYSPYYTTGPDDIFRVYLGAFSTRKGAEQLNNELHEKNIESRIVER